MHQSVAHSNWSFTLFDNLGLLSKNWLRKSEIKMEVVGKKVEFIKVICRGDPKNASRLLVFFHSILTDLHNLASLFCIANKSTYEECNAYICIYTLTNCIYKYPWILNVLFTYLL